MGNAKALAIVKRLLSGNQISVAEAEDLIATIPCEADTAEAAQIRRSIEALIDFKDLKTIGRPYSGRVYGSDIIRGITVRDLEAVIRAYWQGRKRNNAEMGRLVALLETKRYITVPKGQIEATVGYIVGIVNYITAWDIRQIRREYSRISNFRAVDFESATRTERERLEKCTLNRDF